MRRQRARVAGQFQAPCQDQGKGLAAVQDAVVEQRAEGFAFGGIGVLVGLVVARHRRPVQVMQYRDHPGYRQGRRTVDAARTRPWATSLLTTLPWSRSAAGYSAA